MAILKFTGFYIKKLMALSVIRFYNASSVNPKIFYRLYFIFGLFKPVHDPGSRVFQPYQF